VADCAGDFDFGGCASFAAPLNFLVMAMFKKKPDPISDRAKALNAEIAALESKIKKLDTKLQHAPTGPRLRPAAVPQGTVPYRAAQPEIEKPKSEAAIAREPIFEKVDQKPLDSNETAPPEYFNELGIRKYDLPALFRRIRNHFHGPSTTANAKLVNLLAAGGVQGLRPMRYEKRVARNRFIFFAALLFIVLLGTILVFVKHR
jgi:hypothetical protein